METDGFGTRNNYVWTFEQSDYSFPRLKEISEMDQLVCLTKEFIFQNNEMSLNFDYYSTNLAVY